MVGDVDVVEEEEDAVGEVGEGRDGARIINQDVLPIGVAVGVVVLAVAVIMTIPTRGP